MRVALVSLDQVWEAPRENLVRSADRIRIAAAAGAELVVFPELTPTGFTMNAAAFAEPPSASPTIAAFSELAVQHGVGVAFGVVLQGESRPRNTLVIVSSAGAELARYAKVHPFTYAGESDAYEAGAELVVAELGGFRFGLSICYDLRFSGLYSALASAVDGFLVIANWPGQRIAHWQVLLRARAIETQAFVLGVNRTGSDPAGNVYPPSTCTFDPRGESVAAVRLSDDTVLVDVAAAATARWRRSFPILRDARPAVYDRFRADADDGHARQDDPY